MSATLHKELKLFKAEIANPMISKVRRRSMWALDAEGVEELLPLSDEDVLTVTPAHDADTFVQRFSLPKKPGGKTLKEFYAAMARCLRVDPSLGHSMELAMPAISCPLMANTVARARRMLVAGGTTDEIFASMKGVLPEAQIAMLRAGAATGRLPEIFTRLAYSSDKAHNVLRKIRGSLVHPAIIAVLAFVVMMVVSVFLYPKIAEIYDSFDVELPFMTRLLIDITTFIKSQYYILIIFVVAVLYGLTKVKYALKKESVQEFFFQVPFLRRLFNKVSLSQSLRTLSILLSSGVSIQEALELTVDTTDIVKHRRFYRNLRSEIIQGVDPITAVSKNQHFLADEAILFTAAVKIGSETGKLSGVLGDMAQAYEDEVDDVTSNLDKLIEPLMFTVFGILVGGLILSVYLPMISLNKVLIPD